MMKAFKFNLIAEHRSAYVGCEAVGKAGRANGPREPGPRDHDSQGLRTRPFGAPAKLARFQVGPVWGLMFSIAFALILTGCGGRSATDHAEPVDHKHVTTSPTPDAIAYYTCAMHPFVREREPGQCPHCSMDLTPVTNDELESGTVIIDNARRQFIGVRTEAASRKPFVRSLRTLGNVHVNETRLHDVSLKYGGWIGELFADHEEKAVTAGEPLFTVYSPELFSAQQDLLEAALFAQRDPDRGGRVMQAARERLELWDLREDQIDAILEMGSPVKYIPVFSPASGIVVSKHIVAGSPVAASKVLMRIADLSSVWVEAVVHEADVPNVTTGMMAIVRMPDGQGEALEGRIDWVSPVFDHRTRTARVRVELDNRSNRLKPGMFADVEIAIDLGERLAIPREAVIYAGKKRIVFIDLGEGRLRPVEITIGARTRDLVEVISGIAAGDRVVTSGNFLIASESRLKSAVETW